MTGNRTITKPMPVQTDFMIRSTAMYTLQEALARDRMRETERRSRSAQLARSVPAERRWHRVSYHRVSYHRVASRRFATR